MRSAFMIFVLLALLGLGHALKVSGRGLSKTAFPASPKLLVGDINSVIGSSIPLDATDSLNGNSLGAALSAALQGVLDILIVSTGDNNLGIDDNGILIEKLAIIVAALNPNVANDNEINL